jgi:hypothetical protein
MALPPALGEATGHGPGRPPTRAALLAGAFVSALVGATLLLAHVRTVAAAGALLGVHLTAQGVLQLLAVRGSRVPRTGRVLLSCGGLAACVLGLLVLHGPADTVFLLGLWTGCGWLLRGLTLAVLGTSPAVSGLLVCDDLLTAVIVSAGLLMTAFPYASPEQLADVGGLVLIAASTAEAATALRRTPRACRVMTDRPAPVPATASQGDDRAHQSPLAGDHLPCDARPRRAPELPAFLPDGRPARCHPGPRHRR